MNTLMKKLKCKKGFTLIELIVVIAIIGILAAIMLPRFGGFTDKARTTQALTDAKAVATAIDSYHAEKNAWPTKVKEISEYLDGDLKTLVAADAADSGKITSTDKKDGTRQLKLLDKTGDGKGAYEGGFELILEGTLGKGDKSAITATRATANAAVAIKTS